MHVDEVFCHGENGGETWESSHGGYIMRKVVCKELTAGGRFDFFLDSEAQYREKLRKLRLRQSNGCLTEKTCR